MDIDPDVGDSVVWMHYPDDGSPSYVDTINGVICKSNNNIYGGNKWLYRAFLEASSPFYTGTFGYMKLSSAPKYVDMNYSQ